LQDRFAHQGLKRVVDYVMNAMKKQAKDITELYLSKMEEILEFRAFTQLAYLKLNQAIDMGFKFKAQLTPTGKSLDQEQIKQRINKYESGFLPILSFQHSVSIFESWFFDILRYLLKDRNRINKKRKLEVGEVLKSQSIDEIVYKIIEEELNEVRYKKVADWFEYPSSFVNINIPNETEIKKISEIKASRDILVHNEGNANQIYIIKAGELSRAKDGDPLSFDHLYVFESWKVLRNVMESVGNAISSKIDV